MLKHYLLLTVFFFASIAASAQYPEELYYETFTSTPQGITSESYFNWSNFSTVSAWTRSNGAPQCNISGSSGEYYYRTNSTYNSNTRTFNLSYNINTQDYKNIVVSWNSYRATGATGSVRLLFSNNGNTYTEVTGWNDVKTTGIWNTVSASLPASAERTANLRIRIQIDITAGYYALDDLRITGEDRSGKAKLNLSRSANKNNPFGAANSHRGSDNKNVSFKLSSAGGITFSTQAISNATFQSPLYTLSLIQSNASTTIATTLETTFDAPVDSLQFTIFDVDNQSNQFQDILYVEGFLGNSQTAIRPATVTTGTYSRYVARENKIEALTNYNAVADNSDAANVTVSFGQPIDKMVIYYYNGSTARGNQGIGIHNLYWKEPVMTPLPVELISFSGKAVNNTTILNWSTAAELNNDKFIIERSEDGRNFEHIGEVKGVGNSKSTNYYSYTDFRPEQELNYYRLLQLDLDGTGAYSKIIAVKGTSGLSTLQVYPNPVKSGDLTIKLPVPGEAAILKLQDVNGRLLKEGTYSGGSPVVFPVSELKAGIYLLTVEQQGQLYQVKLVKE